MQKTISKIVTCAGFGVHSGKETILTFKPGEMNSNITFVRVDLECVNDIKANSENVSDTRMSTNITNEFGAKVSTIEHLMAAIWACGIDNLIIEINNAEVPIMDGSSKSFIEILKTAGIQDQSAPKRVLKLLKEITVVDKDCEIVAIPSESLELEVSIDFAHAAIGKQSHSCTSPENFVSESADARTFGFLKDLEYLQKMGLAKGTSLENTIGIDDEKVMNPEGLRHKNEFARHKLLDLIGDLFTCGGNFIFKLKGYKTSHSLNNQFLRKVFSDSSNYKWIDLE